MMKFLFKVIVTIIKNIYIKAKLFTNESVSVVSARGSIEFANQFLWSRPEVL